MDFSPLWSRNVWLNLEWEGKLSIFHSLLNGWKEELGNGDFKTAQHPLICYLAPLGIQLETSTRTCEHTSSHAGPLGTPSGDVRGTSSVLIYLGMVFGKYHTPSHSPQLIAQLSAEAEADCSRATPAPFLISFRPCYSSCDLQTRIKGITSGLVRNVESWAPPQTCWIGIIILTWTSDNSYIVTLRFNEHYLGSLK